MRFLALFKMLAPKARAKVMHCPYFANTEPKCLDCFSSDIHDDSKWFLFEDTPLV